MSKKENEVAIATDAVMSQIFNIRGCNVMLDFHLANLYQVENRVLKQAVKRKQQRFPEDFMFQLTKEEWRELITICDNLPAGVKYSPATPFAFSEQGVAMLSSVLNSDRAVAVNIQIMRIFTRMRQLLVDNSEVKLEIAEIKYAVEQIAKKQKGHDQNIDLLFEYIDRLQEKQDTPQPPRPELGFKIGKK